MDRFLDRQQAGQVLGQKLQRYAGRDDVVVLGLPRGGVPVAWEVSRALGAPLDVLVVRKLGVPGHEELAMGAVASGDVRVVNREVVSTLRIDAETFEAVARREHQELVRRERAYRGERPPLDLEGRTAIVVDDGLATGTSMQAAVTALRHRWPAHLVVAVPVGAESTCQHLASHPCVDEVVCVRSPEPFFAVGLWYHNFRQVTDDEVRDLLAESARRWEHRGEPPRDEAAAHP